MKIVSQTSDELILKEGNASGMVLGIVFVIAGIGVGFYSHAPNIIWVAIGLFIIGLVSILLSSSITVDINKTNGQLVYQKKSLVKGKTTTYATADILRIETRKEWRMEGSAASGNQSVSMPRQVLVSQSVIVFKDGTELPLDHQKNSSGMSVGSAVLMGGSGAEIAIANQVANFLGVPFQEIAPPTSGIRINTGTGGGIQF
jgi:hypothetical protein